jgi:hypothetical protein
MAVTGLTLGSIQVVLTALVVVGVWAAWNAFEDEVEREIAQANELAEADLSFTDMLGGVTDGVSLGDLGDLAGSLGQFDELQGAAEQCQAGDVASCEDLLESVPEGLVPEELSGQLPGSG